MDGQPPYPGWSPTIQNLPEGCVLQTLNLAYCFTKVSGLFQGNYNGALKQKCFNGVEI